MKFLYSLICLGLLLSCNPKTASEGPLTEIPFAVTGSKEAMPHFQKGLLLLHNFEYEDAAVAFIDAQRIDPQFSMAYWGEALTYNHPIWQQLDIEKARAALNKLGSTPEERNEKARTDLEKDFIHSIEILFGPESKPDRDAAYAVAMEQMYKKYPGNTEVASFYALALIGAAPGWNEENSMKAGAAAESVLNTMPNHPGALHYLIHAYDHPVFAQKAIDAAYKYDKAASYSGHALHMPSHIYLALGMWDNVVQSNEISWKAESDRKEKLNLDNDAFGYHAHLWLLYGYLQQGRHAEARKLLENQFAFTRELPSQRARFHLMEMKGHYFVETGDWKDSLANEEFEVDDLTVAGRAVNRLINGLNAFSRVDSKTLITLAKEMEEDLAASSKLRADSEGVTICGSASFNKIPSKGQLGIGNTIMLELKGLAAWSEQKLPEAERWLSEAASKEDDYLVGPPSILKPSHELFAEFLLASGRYQDANREFELALKYSPKRQLSLRGLLAVANQTGDTERAKELEKQLAAIQLSQTQGKAAL
jgi:tetratricopeptide (TPR) repeat protein